MLPPDSPPLVASILATGGGVFMLTRERPWQNVKPTDAPTI
nr:MAG TPA: hypothetical protein [Caudoviricetes sp.]